MILICSVGCCSWEQMKIFDRCVQQFYSFFFPNSGYVFFSTGALDDIRLGTDMVYKAVTEF